MGDDRPKKSWSEIDKMREKGRTRRDPSERQREKASNSAAYSKYKNQLDKLFTPGGNSQLPESMKAKLGPVSDEGKAAQKATEELRKTPNEKTLKAYLKTGIPLPEDARLLMGLLTVKDEKLVQALLGRLLEIVEDGKKPNRMLLIQRLEAVKNSAAQKGTLELVDMIRAALD